MRNKWTKMAAATTILAILSGAPLSAGGLSDQIIEQQQVMAPAAPVAQNGLPGWVLPAAGLLLLGALVAANDDDDGDDPTDVDNGGGDEPPIVIDVK